MRFDHASRYCLRTLAPGGYAIARASDKAGRYPCGMRVCWSSLPMRCVDAPRPARPCGVCDWRAPARAAIGRRLSWGWWPGACNGHVASTDLNKKMGFTSRVLGSGLTDLLKKNELGFLKKKEGRTFKRKTRRGFSSSTQSGE